MGEMPDGRLSNIDILEMQKRATGTVYSVNDSGSVTLQLYLLVLLLIK